MDPIERNDQSFVFMLETDAGAPRTLRLHPTIIAGFQARLARGSAPDIAARLQQVEEQLEQCWDLLRQRRAKKDYGEHPDEAEVRPVSEVEGCQS